MLTVKPRYYNIFLKMPAANPPNRQSEIEKKIDGFIEYLQVERGSSTLTIRNYKHYLMRFADWLRSHGNHLSLDDINPETVRHFRVHLASLPGAKGKGEMSRKTQGYHAIALRSFLKWMTKNDLVVMSAEKIELPKISDRQVKFLNAEQMERLLNAPSLSTLSGKRDKAILEALYSTGLRVSELVKLDRDKIDIERREFGVVGKGGRARVVFLSDSAVDWLENYLRARTDHFSPMFIRHKGKVDPATDDEKMRLTVRSVQRIIKKYAEKIRLPVEVTPHVLRHSFATDLLMAGADLRSVQEMLGHKNVQTTQIYTHVTHKHLKDIHAAFHGRGGN